MEKILVVGFNQHEFRNLKNQIETTDTTYEYVVSPGELYCKITSEKYNCIYCSNSVLDYLPYIHILRNIEDVPIIIGSIENCEAVGALQHYVHSFIAPNSCIEVDAIHINLEHRCVYVDGKEILLTSTEFDILSLLAANIKRVFTYEMIMDIVWNEDCTFYSRKTIHNHISSIKKKIAAIFPEHRYIVTVHGVGYKFEIAEPKD